MTEFQGKDHWKEGRPKYKVKFEASRVLCAFKHKWSVNWKEKRKRCLRCGKVKQF